MVPQCQQLVSPQSPSVWGGHTHHWPPGTLQVWECRTKVFLHKIVILINKAKSLEQCLCRVKCDPVHIYCPESSTGPSPGPPTGLPAQATALGLPKNSKYLSVLVEKLVLAGRALRVFAGEKQKQLADKFVSNQEQFSGFTICVGKIFFPP